MSKKARWKIKRDLRKEESYLGDLAGQGAAHLQKEKKWSKNMGMLGALLVPMAVATTFATGGAAAPLWATVLAAGGGALAGAKLGEEAAEFSTSGKITLGEDKFSGGRSKDAKRYRNNLVKGKFTSQAGSDLGNALITQANALDTGMLKDAVVAGAMAGVQGLGGVKGIKKGVQSGELTSKAGLSKAFGFTDASGMSTKLATKQAWKAGREKTNDSIKKGLGSAKDSFVGMFTGDNKAKKILQEELSGDMFNLPMGDRIMGASPYSDPKQQSLNITGQKQGLTLGYDGKSTFETQMPDLGQSTPAQFMNESGGAFPNGSRNLLTRSQVGLAKSGFANSFQQSANALAEAKSTGMLGSIAKTKQGIGQAVKSMGSMVNNAMAIMNKSTTLPGAQPNPADMSPDEFTKYRLQRMKDGSLSTSPYDTTGGK
tara:strand:- start:7575 stop:8858 length:1284 start_codon:yes stop_codon:yes gene_type:complete